MITAAGVCTHQDVMPGQDVATVWDRYVAVKVSL